MFRIYLSVLFLAVASAVYSQYEGSDGVGFGSVTANYSSCSLYYGGEGIGATQSNATNSSGCAMFAGGAGIGYMEKKESEISNCVMFGGGDGVGYEENFFMNPMACLPYRSSIIGGIGYDARSLSEFVPVCIIIPLGMDCSPLMGHLYEGKALLSWFTDSENKVSGFEVHKSLDGITFEKIGWLDGKGFSDKRVNYQFVDKKVSVEGQYYQFKLVDFEGDKKSSNIVFVDLQGNMIEQEQYTLYPNPSMTNRELILKSWNGVDRLMEIEVYDVSGRLLYRSEHQFNKANPSFVFPTGFLSTGSYYLKVASQVDDFEDTVPFIILH